MVVGIAERLVRVRAEEERVVHGERRAVGAGRVPALALGERHLGRHARDGLESVLAHARVKEEERAARDVVVRARRAEEETRAGDRLRLGDDADVLGVVAVDVRHGRAVGARGPERLEPHGMAVDVVPPRVGDATVVHDGGLPLVRLAEGYLPDVLPARVGAVEEERRHVAAPVAAAVVLSARGGEHEPAVRQVARVDVLDHRGLASALRLHRVAGAARHLAHPAAVRRALVDEVAAVGDGALAARLEAGSVNRMRGIDLLHPRVVAHDHLGHLQFLSVSRRLRRVVAEGEEDAVRVPVEVGVDHRARRELVAEQGGLLRRGLPVLEHDEAGARTAPAAEVLVHHVVLARIRDAALDGEQLLELEVGVAEEDAAA